MKLFGAWKKYREKLLAAVKRDGRSLRKAVAPFKSQREIVLAAVKGRGLALRYAAASCKGDRGVVLAAVQQDSRTKKSTKLKHFQSSSR
eukprot:4396309-Amphidinium_carterae.1